MAAGCAHPRRRNPVLNQLTIRQLSDPRLWYGSQNSSDDPRCQNEDLGDNAMKAGDYGILNLKRIMARLPEWTRRPNEDYSDLKGIYGELVTQYNRYMGHVQKNIGGQYTTPRTVEQAGPVYQRTPAAMQRAAMDFLDRQLRYPVGSKGFAARAAEPAEDGIAGGDRHDKSASAGSGGPDRGGA